MGVKSPLSLRVRGNSPLPNGKRGAATAIATPRY